MKLNKSDLYIIKNPPKLDLDNWDLSVLRLIYYGQLDYSYNELKNTSNSKYNYINVEITRVAEVGYAIMKLISSRDPVINIVTRGFTESQKSDLVKMANKVISDSEEFLKYIMLYKIPKGSRILVEYNIGGINSYKYKIDNFNRFIFTPFHSATSLDSILFHINDDIEESKSITESIGKFNPIFITVIFDMFNKLIGDINFRPKLLTEVYNKLSKSSNWVDKSNRELSKYRDVTEENELLKVQYNKYGSKIFNKIKNYGK